MELTSLPVAGWSLCLLLDLLYRAAPSHSEPVGVASSTSFATLVPVICQLATACFPLPMSEFLAGTYDMALGTGELLRRISRQTGIRFWFRSGGQIREKFIRIARF